MSSFSFLGRTLLAALTLVPVIQGLSIPATTRASLSDLIRRDTCENGPDSRDCWGGGFDINSDVYDSWPDTGKTVTYDFRITNQTCNPDGHGEKWCQLVNGQFPGPTIHANWGDKVQVTVHNDLEINGTSIHWHGIRQINSCEMDGVNGVTECPIAPGGSRTYEWVATQYGTSWYHSHHTAQYGEGILGPIVIDGPATSNYDVDLGSALLHDWHYKQIFELLPAVDHVEGPPPTAQNVLFNGTMIDGNGNGHYQQLNVEPGKRYRLRLVNTAVDHFFHVSLDNHPFTVISADFVAINPYQTTDLKIGIGQRYDVIIEADQGIANYWLRVSPAQAALECGFADIYNNDTSVVVGAILSYDGAPSNTYPTTAPYPNDGTCNDETFTPYLANSKSGSYAGRLDALNLTQGFDNGLVHWYINGSSFDVDWEDPTLSFVEDGRNFTRSMNVLEMPKANSWYLWVIENAATPNIPHPIHLHGHDFEVLGSGAGAFPWGQGLPNIASPIRRDVAMLPANGWLLLGVYTDNPGAWLMHCHIAWHASQGLSLQFVERRSEIVKSIGSLDDMNSGCQAWSDYWDEPARVGIKEDSGI